LSDDEPKIKVFASDDNLKSLGELLSNDTSRLIISNLMTQEMYTNEISTKLDMRVSLVIHHLKKMQDLGMLHITNKKIKRKGVEHRFFKINFDIFITVDKTKEDLEKKGLLKRIFRETIKFTAIGIAAVSSWVFSKFFLFTNEGIVITDTTDGIQLSTGSDFTLPLIIIIIGLIIEIIFSKKKRLLQI